MHVHVHVVDACASICFASTAVVNNVINLKLKKKSLSGHDSQTSRLSKTDYKHFFKVLEGWWYIRTYIRACMYMHALADFFKESEKQLFIASTAP